MDVWTINGGFIKGILRGVRCTKSLRVSFYIDGPPPGRLLYCTQEQYSSLMNPPLLYSLFTEVEFLEEIQTEVLRVFLLAIHRHLYKQIVLPSFSFLGLEISTALPCDFYSNSWGGGDVWVNKYLDHWRVSNYQANRLLKSSHEIWTQIVSFDFQYFHHWTIEDIYVTSKITCVKTKPHST